MLILVFVLVYVVLSIFVECVRLTGRKFLKMKLKVRHMLYNSEGHKVNRVEESSCGNPDCGMLLAKTGVASHHLCYKGVMKCYIKMMAS
jgi:hypothetical protein